MKTIILTIVLLAACWTTIAVLHAQEIRRAIPVEREVRKAIPLEPMQDAAVPMDHDYIHNGLLPYDAVELADDEAISDGDFYMQQPPRKPVNVPSTFVLVSVFQRESDDVCRFVGWVYMDAEQVNGLHLNLVAL